MNVSLVMLLYPSYIDAARFLTLEEILDRLWEANDVAETNTVDRAIYWSRPANCLGLHDCTFQQR